MKIATNLFFCTCIAALLLIGIYFRFLSLDTIPGINGDEAYIGSKVKGFLEGYGLDLYSYSANISNPFFLFSSVLAHVFLPAGGTALRIGAAIGGVLALLINFWFALKALGVRFALATTLLLSSSPMAILHSRFGWEPTHIPLFASAYIGCSLVIITCPHKKLILFLAGLLICLAGLLVHPTFLFCTPVLPMALLSHLLLPEKNWGKLTLFVILSLLLVTLTSVGGYLFAPSWIRNEIANRISQFDFISDSIPFLFTWMRVFNGINSFQYLAGSWPIAVDVLTTAKEFRTSWLDWATIFLFSIAFLTLFMTIKNNILHHSNSSFSRIGLVLGVSLTATTIWFWIVSGSAKAAVWFDRYSLWVLVPGLWFLSWGYIALRNRIISHDRIKKHPLILYLYDLTSLMMCGLLLLHTWNSYFAFFYRTGGEAHISSRSGVSFEPKFVAADKIQSLLPLISHRNRPLLLSADWFVYWPVVYKLDFNSRNKLEFLRVANEPDGTPILTDDFFEKISNRIVIVIEYTGAKPWETWHRIFEGCEILEQKTFTDLSERPVLDIRIYNTNMRDLNE